MEEAIEWLGESEEQIYVEPWDLLGFKTNKTMEQFEEILFANYKYLIKIN